MKQTVYPLQFVFVILSLFIWPLTAYGDYKADIGYALLTSELGGITPDGDGVHVTQVEALSGDAWMPNVADSQFSGKNIYDKSTGHPSGYSGHANTVGRYFYGNTISVAPGVEEIDTYVAGHSQEPPWQWLVRGFLKPWDGPAWNRTWFHPWYDIPDENPDCLTDDIASPSRVANHSWVGTASTSEILRRLDFAIDSDEFIQVTGMNNGSVNKELLSSAFNVISVGNIDGNHPTGSVAKDGVYTGERTKPEIVAPFTRTSWGTPVVAASAAVLIEVGRDTAPSNGSTTNRDGDIISNAERSEVVKAALMAGADRFTDNDSTEFDIFDYRGAVDNRSDNGLDERFGAGQVNVHHSYYIVAEGEQESDRTGSGNILWNGFDVDDAFGVSVGTPHSARYTFTTDETHCRLAASLVWNIRIEGGNCDNFSGVATLYNYDLVLYDITGGGRQLVAGSFSTVDNTENLWIALQKDRDYEIEVLAVNEGQDFSWDYALAWRVFADGDIDGIADYWELKHNLDPEDPSDGGDDPDTDLLTNLEEFGYETDPKDSDTDDDSSNDGDEVAFWLSVDCSGFGCDDCLNCDIDSDGEANNLRDDDADGDTFLDGIEIQYGTDPADAKSQPEIPAVPANKPHGLLAAALLLLAGGALMIGGRQR